MDKVEDALKYAENGCDHGGCGECVGSCLDGCVSKHFDVLTGAFTNLMLNFIKQGSKIIDLESEKADLEAKIEEGLRVAKAEVWEKSSEIVGWASDPQQCFAKNAKRLRTPNPSEDE